MKWKLACIAGADKWKMPFKTLERISCSEWAKKNLSSPLKQR